MPSIALPAAIREPFFGSSIVRAAIIAAFGVAFGVLMGGCSMLRIGYAQAPDLVYWWLDGYVDFNGEQTTQVRTALAAWFDWNRRTQLPDYIALLARAEKEVLADTTPERACAWWGELNKRMDTALDRAAPDAAAVLLTFKPEQVQRLESRYAKSNTEFRDDYLQPDPVKRSRAAMQRTVERAESLYGSLNEAQEARIAKALAQSPFDADVWLSERQRRQQDALQTLRKLLADGATVDQAQAALRAYVDRVEHSPREGYRRYSEHLMEFNCGFAAELHNSTTPTQRRNAAQKLKGWEADLRSLTANAAS